MSMPKLSNSKNILLYSLEELSALTKRGYFSVYRQAQKVKPYSETENIHHSTGSKLTRYFDPSFLPGFSRLVEAAPANPTPALPLISEGVSTDLAVSRIPQHIPRNLERKALLFAVLEHPEEKRHTEIERLAEILECHPRTVRRWLDQLTETKAVGRKTREDKGNFRIPPHTYSLVIHTLISNPLPPAST
jgi:hypothetical protein